MADAVGPRLYSCFKCRNLVSFHDDIVTKTFQAGTGRRAFLFSHAMNVVAGPEEDRQFITGLHRVCDVYCSDCGECLVGSTRKLMKHHRSTRKGNSVL